MTHEAVPTIAFTPVSYQTSGKTAPAMGRTMPSRPRRLDEMLGRFSYGVENRLEEDIRKSGPHDAHDAHETGHDDIWIIVRPIGQGPRELLRDVRWDRRLRDDHPDHGPHRHHMVRRRVQGIWIDHVRQQERHVQAQEVA